MRRTEQDVGQLVVAEAAVDAGRVGGNGVGEWVFGARWV
jgi:hypothetical protein